MAIRTLHDVWSPELRNRRTVDVYLPPSYAASARRHPVVYMQDGQNLSDPALAYAGTWNMPGVLRALGAGGVEPIIVGIHHAGERRIAEYSPYADSRHGGGRGDAYVRFVARTLKPRIDRAFRTRRGRDFTAIAGSSMGGLISLHAFFRCRSVFGRAAAMSPALWFGDRRVFEFVERSRAPRGRLYLDVGTAEGAETLRDVRRMRRVLQAKGYGRGALWYVEAEGAPHREAEWGARLAPALAFLFGPAARGI
jgi:predicted alpha/beta superfamily hydrolase